jgi:ABC-type sugar transport system ATPase subunit
LRDGHNVFDGPANTSSSILIGHMVGHQVEKQIKQASEKGSEVLNIKSLTDANPGKKAFHNISFHVHAGEILGIAGVVGCGAIPLGKAIFGLHPIQSGELNLFGNRYQPKSPRYAVTRGLSFISEDRKYESIIQGITIRRNISVTILKAITRASLIHRKREIERADPLVEELKIKPNDPLKLVDQLSGGNQQKVAIAKWLCSGSKLFIISEPTRGMDVQAREDVYKILRRLVEQGAAVIAISSDLQEIASLCDRALVMRNGSIVEELNHDALSEEALLGVALGAEENVV